ncbi:Conserved_hypothetical protein [Hexamita inflata]|uniref:Uncharacterized protein n=1 Tax=Hexamita inflata TaxID=28002 RepID=A0AA86UEM7_9EUKA|nr:Conserved hypothetical protein [Hexamita inflata]
MELLQQKQLDTKGPSCSLILNETTVLVRQSTKLQVFDLKSQKVTQTFDLNLQYNSFPCVIVEGVYIELQPQLCYHVDVMSQVVQSQPSREFIGGLNAASFVSYQNYLLILNRSHLYLFDALSQDLLPVTKLPACDNGALFISSQKQVGICSFDSDQLYVLDTTSHALSPREFGIESKNGQAVALNSQEILLFGPLMNQISSKAVYLIDLKNQTRNTLLVLENPITESHLAINKDTVILTDDAGMLMVFRIENLNQQQNTAQQLKVSTKKKFQTAQTIYQRDKYDIFCDFLFKEVETFKKNCEKQKTDKILNETCLVLEDIIRGMLNDKTGKSELKTLIQQGLTLTLKDQEIYFDSLKSEVEKKKQEEIDASKILKQLQEKKKLVKQTESIHEKEETDKMKLELQILKRKMQEELDNEIEEERRKMMKELGVE